MSYVICEIKGYPLVKCVQVTDPIIDTFLLVGWGGEKSDTRGRAARVSDSEVSRGPADPRVCAANRAKVSRYPIRHTDARWS